MVKISVSHEEEGRGEEKAPPKKIKESAPVKKVPRKALPKKIVKKPAVKKPSPKKITKTYAKKDKSGLSILVIATVVTTLVVGGGIYAWQKSTGTKILTEARKEALETKMSFEERLATLKSKLTGVETENVELREKAEELARRALLLGKAKIDFIDEELGLAFTYPALFGEITITKTEIASGTKYLGTFTDNDKLVFGGVSASFELPRSQATATLAVIDNLGYTQSRRDYFWLGPGEREHEINPVEVIKFDGGEALLVDQNSFAIDSEEDGLPVDIGENVAVIFNLDNDEYTGLAFLNQDFGMLPLESYKEMIKSIKLINQ